MPRSPHSRPHPIPRALLAGSLIVALAALVLLAQAGGPAAAQGAGNPSCAAALNPGGTVNEQDTVRAGAASPLPVDWPARRHGLPKRVDLRTTTTSFNRLYEFALLDGDLYARRRGAGEPWRLVPLPSCLAGHLTAISADDDEMIGLDHTRQVYAMDNALKDPSQWNWSSRWGPPVWTGSGFTIPGGTKAWTWSVISRAEDETWTDPAGNRTPVGDYKVSHIWGLRGGGRLLDFWDPWLPRDNSYQMCGPHRSRFRAVNISASGSHVVVGKREGTILASTTSTSPAMMRSSSTTPTRSAGAGDGAPIQLPAEPWTRQPKIHGTITSAISISKFGLDAVHGRLRVAGRKDGETGYWQRDLAAPRKKGWRFHVTGGPLPGKVLHNPRGNTSKRGLGPSADIEYSGDTPSGKVRIPNFNAHCSPATVEVTGTDGDTRRLTLHSVDGLRQVERAENLDSNPREYYGALEYPSGEIRTVTVLATSTELVVPELGWTLTRAG
ncbi:MAG: hypothetical protein R2700_11145 [Solirubrobacterales bacterium]